MKETFTALPIGNAGPSVCSVTQQCALQIVIGRNAYFV